MFCKYIYYKGKQIIFMNLIKSYHKFNESEQTKFSKEDIIKCYEEDRPIFAEIIGNFPNNDKDLPLKVVSVDDDGLISVLIDNELKFVELKNVDRLGNEKLGNI